MTIYFVSFVMGIAFHVEVLGVLLNAANWGHKKQYLK